MWYSTCWFRTPGNAATVKTISEIYRNPGRLQSLWGVTPATCLLPWEACQWFITSCPSPWPLTICHSPSLLLLDLYPQSWTNLKNNWGVILGVQESKKCKGYHWIRLLQTDSVAMPISGYHVWLTVQVYLLMAMPHFVEPLAEGQSSIHLPWNDFQ